MSRLGKEKVLKEADHPGGNNAEWGNQHSTFAAWGKGSWSEESQSGSNESSGDGDIKLSSHRGVKGKRNIKNFTDTPFVKQKKGTTAATNQGRGFEEGGVYIGCSKRKRRKGKS